MPHEWWESARKMTRNFHFHMGPTNSGKTYSALSQLQSSKTGIYCGPLRLLAAEIYEKLNASGVKCSLFTGQEVRIIPESTHTSCTIEGLRFENYYHCAVLDEIQMISDYRRGSAWTNAVLGLQCPEIHLTGELRAKTIVKSLLEKTGDMYTEEKYSRLSSLSICAPVTSVKDLKPGDCLIAFSRKKCHALKNHIEKTMPGSCAIIYGSLPPEVRKDQALRFNSGQHKYLVATDAVGLGLNYNISRVVFMETSKSDGMKKRRKLTHFEIKQIAGRAGRHENKGLVTAVDMQNLVEVSIALSHSQDQAIAKAGLSPNYEQIKEFADSFFELPEKTPYATILKHFARQAKLENIYFLQSIEESCMIAEILQNIGLSLEDMHKFCNTSMKINMPGFAKSVNEIARGYMNNEEVRYTVYPDPNECELEKLEALYSQCEMYLSLSRKFKHGIFVDSLEVIRYLEDLSAAILQKLNTEVEDALGLS